MRAASFALVVLGGLLSFGPLAWLWLAGWQRAATLTAERTAIRSAAERGDGAKDEESQEPADADEGCGSPWLGLHGGGL